MDKLIGAFVFLRNRLKEPSSLLSLALVMKTIGVQIDESTIQAWLDMAALIFGVLGFFVAEAKPLTKVD